MVGVAPVYVSAVEGMMPGVGRRILCKLDVEERVMVKQPVRHGLMVRRSAMRKESHLVGIAVMMGVMMEVGKVIRPVVVSGYVLKPE